MGSACSRCRCRERGQVYLGFVRFNPPGPQLVKCSTALTFLIFFGSIKTDYIEGLNNFQSSMETFIIIVALNDS